MKITDLIKEMAPECETECIGIRPGEKIHESLVTPDEARHTLQFDDYFVIVPEAPLWKYEPLEGGTSLPDDFSYRSDINDQWLTAEDLRGDGKEHMRSIPYGHQWIDEADIKEVTNVLKSDWITQGPKIKEFEDALCEYTGASYAVAVSNGTAALHIACLAAGFKEGDEVICSPNSFAASSNCVLYSNSRPVFADIIGETAAIDPESFKSRITERTKGVIPVHFAGHPCRIDDIRQIADDNDLVVIDDAAQALGAAHSGKKIGCGKHSDMTTFSFHPVKSIATGEGGAVMTDNPELYKKLILLRQHGISKDIGDMSRSDGPWYYEMQELGFNCRITDFQCALGLSQLKKLDDFINIRNEIAAVYNNSFCDLENMVPLSVLKGSKSAWHIYVIRLKPSISRRKVFDSLREKGLGVNVHYIPIYKHPYYENLGFDQNKCPEAELYYESCITLPLYPSMLKDDVEYVINSVRETVG